VLSREPRTEFFDQSGSVASSRVVEFCGLFGEEIQQPLDGKSLRFRRRGIGPDVSWDAARVGEDEEFDVVSPKPSELSRPDVEVVEVNPIAGRIPSASDQPFIGMVLEPATDQRVHDGSELAPDERVLMSAGGKMLVPEE
jgi:hypothetical protein